MYVIIVYDVEIKRINRIHKYLKTYLNWTQNSVFEGELTKGQFKEIEIRLKRMINKKIDSVLIFSVENKNTLQRQIIGIEKNPLEVVL